jgi:hypothetical protein
MSDMRKSQPKVRSAIHRSSIHGGGARMEILTNTPTFNVLQFLPAEYPQAGTANLPEWIETGMVARQRWMLN